jgi:hypothetical protein
VQHVPLKHALAPLCKDATSVLLLLLLLLQVW